MPTQDLVHFVADVGKPSRLGWVREDGVVRSVGAGPDALCTAIGAALLSGRSVTLGLEVPLYLPVSDNPIYLTRPRDGEGNRAWCAPAGAAVTAVGIPTVAWIMRRLGQQPRQPAVHTTWASFAPAAGPALYVWEAFISRRTPSATGYMGTPAPGYKWVIKAQYALKFDQADAITALDCFLPQLGNQPSALSGRGDERNVNLVHAALTWAQVPTTYAPRDESLLVLASAKPTWPNVPIVLGTANVQLGAPVPDCLEQKR